jgi:hypothetical protein
MVDTVARFFLHEEDVRDSKMAGIRKIKVDSQIDGILVRLKVV